MSKVRVYELAKELGVESKTLLNHLKEQGEFVRSASSTIEAPVVRKVKQAFGAAPQKSGSTPRVSRTPGVTRSRAPRGGAKPAPRTRAAKPGPEAPKPTPAGKAARPPMPTPAEAVGAVPPPTPPPSEPTFQTEAQAPKNPAPKKPARPEVPTPAEAVGAVPPPTPAPAAKPGGRGPASPKPGQAAPSGRSDAPKPGGRGAAPKPGGRGAAPKPGPRPGNNPYSPSQGMPRPGGTRGGGPRPGNNPFAPSQGMPRPGGSRGGQGGPRPGPRPGGRQGAPRPGGAQGRGGAGGRPAPRPGVPRPNPGMMPQSASVPRPGQRPSRGGGGGRGPGGGGGFRGRGGGFRGRGGTQGAFGRGGKPARGRKSRRAKRQEFEQMQAPVIGGVRVPRGKGKTIRIRRGATLSDLADRINVDPASLVTVLMHLGEMATATQSLDEDTFKLLGAELEYEIEMVSPEDEERELLQSFNIDLEAEEEEESEEDLEPRPPVVTVMGHVDHGKTRLLDAIRDANVIEGEAGGITQHIGAYQVTKEHEGEERKLTFIDTPGHQAFTAMRARGAKVTDIAILVVAATDGVMPQTVEALNHAQAAEVPIVVAVNKIDLPESNPDKVRAQLTEYGLIAEEYGGDTMFVNVSAKEGTGIDDLLEAVLLTADAALELVANPDKDARGVAIEANLDRGRGATATVLVQAGTLCVGDSIVAGSSYGRVRAMLDEYGNAMDVALPSRPVQVLGLSSVPRAGDTFIVAPDDRTARQIAEKREAADRQASLAKARKRISLETLNEALAAGKVDTLNLILKGDVSGSVEALEDSLLQIDVGDEVGLRIIDRGVGAITMDNINLAVASEAVIIAFNVRAEGQNADYAEQEGVDIKYYTVIYQAIEEVEAALKGMLKPEYEEKERGTAEIREIFRSSKFGNIAGSVVKSGLIKRGTKARITRDGVVVVEGLEITGLRRFKDDVTEVREGFECGINLGSHNDIQVGDLITTYEMVEIPRI